MKRVYWVGLLGFVRELCRYWIRYKAKMPGDLPPNVIAACDAITLACSTLEAYDLSHARGN